ncbi:MAG: Ig-like domain-containing protein, partial [Micropruina sp.]
ITVQTVNAGAALQVTAGANASGKLTFRYQVDDGREGGKDEATVTLTVAPPGQNSPPKQKRVQTVLLEVGATATFDALMGWFDPEGDDVYLQHAGSGVGDRITFRNNGVIQFTEATGELGIHEVKVTASDGAASADGVFRVVVRPKGSLAPVANADRYATLTDDRITISPLANDLSSSGKELRLAKLDQTPGAKITPDFSAGTFSFEAPTAGTYYVQYLVTDGPNATSGIVRVDVRADASSELAPLATRDIALLRPSQQALVDVLANDTDPAGGILVLQSVTVPAGSQVSAEVLEHHILRIRDNGLKSPVTISYRVSNGARWADGVVRVIPVTTSEEDVPPVTAQDRAVVRAGDIVTVDVTANDFHPAGDTLELLPGLKEAPDLADGVAFVSEGTVRFRAGAEEKMVALVYEVSDSQNNVTAGYLRIQIIAADGSANAAPLPESVIARSIAGTSVRVPIPLDGIDPDGDSVELIGTSSAPKKGRVSVGDTWLVYEAYPGTTGRDSFDYVVRDRRGAVATGTVVVGIAAPSSQNQAPYTVRDTVGVRPGRSVSVPVLANDTDPDGDTIGLAKRLTTPNGVSAEVVVSRILVHAPPTEGDYSITYTAVDEFGASSLGTLIVKVSATSVLQVPIARDDRVQPAQLGGEKTVTVPVLANDEDPDGVADELVVSTDEANAVVRPDGALEVTLTPERQLILYTVTDLDGQTAKAAVFVPGTESLLPTLKNRAPIEVVSGKEVRLVLSDLIVVRHKRTPRVADADSVRAGHANGTSMVIDGGTLTYTSDPDYVGPDAVSVQVTDGEGPDDPKGNTAYVSIPVTVLPSGNEPPLFLNTSVVVAPGEGAVDLNLNKLASDPNPEDAGKLTFKTRSVPPTLQTRIEDGHLFVSADSNAAPGTTLELTLEVSDQTTTTTGTVTVLVSTSQRELPVAVDDVIDRAEQGRTVSVDVLRNDHNPFPDTALVIVSATVLAGDGTATVNGSSVNVTPAENFVGTMQVSYRIQDATRTPEREAEATISVTVQGAPDQPSKPIVVTVGDRKVVLQWTPPGNNGRPITGYTVTSKVGGFSQKCSSTTCTLTGLTNDTEYTFRVVATNDVGDSEPSAPSAVARPDTRPDTPAPPKLEFGDGSLTVTWKTPRSSGSPVTSFNLEISPAPDSGAIQLTGITGNRYVWRGLRNGTSYQVKVQAVNRAPEPSEWSPYSLAEVPAGPPNPPGQPTTNPATPVGDQAQITVSWPGVTGAAANGSPVTGYTLDVLQGGSQVRSIEVTGTRKNVTVDPSTSDYSFRVTATNKAGTSPA